MVGITSYRNKLEQLKGKRKLLKEQQEQASALAKLYNQRHENCLKARAVVQHVAEATQKKLEYQISSLVSAAIASVFSDPYDFSLRFVQKRNKTEALLIFSKNGNETDDLLNTGGGGVVDIASFALRVALWSIKRSRPVFILDESFRFLSIDLQEKASAMLKEISEKLKVQIILVSHLPNMIAAADNIIHISNRGGVSYVTRDVSDDGA